MSKKSLSPMQELFVKEYLIDLNATAACLRAGYSKRNPKNADKIGPELLGNPRVKAAIQAEMDKRAERIRVSADEILRRIDTLADFDPAEIYDEKGHLKSIHEMPVHIRKCIKSVEVFEEFEGVGKDRTKIGEIVKVHFHDRLKANELYGRHLKLFTDKIELSATGKLAEMLAKAKARVKK